MLAAYLALIPAVLAIWPPVGGPIYADKDQKKCLTAAGRWNGAKVDVQRCDGGKDQRWHVNPGSTKVRLGKSNFCLDAGGSPGNGVGAKVNSETG